MPQNIWHPFVKETTTELHPPKHVSMRSDWRYMAPCKSEIVSSYHQLNKKNPQKREKQIRTENLPRPQLSRAFKGC